MNETEFNLIDEKWIRVMDSKCNMSEISLKEVILDSHKYKALSGELPTQDIAVMRLILAVLHTVYSRVDENGIDAPLDEDDEDEALDRWKALWDKGHFSEKAIGDYFDKWHERFWLFHGERPFFQIKESDMKIAGQNPLLLSKLNGEIAKSGNKKNFFSQYSGEEMDSMSYSQAARWLVFLNSYDDTAFKPQGENTNSATVGWLGQIGTIYIRGETLFETLMLNLALVNDDHIENNQVPIWEKESIRTGERIMIPFPSNLAELYTVQSRRIHLYRNDGEITHYHILAGDLFSAENSFEEPMTAWHKDAKSKNIDYKPNIHDYPTQMWREFSALYNSKGSECAGIIIWYKKYLSKILGHKNTLKTSIVSIKYDKSSAHKVLNYFSDSLTMHSGLLSELGDDWRNTIEQEIEKCSELANAIGYLAQNLYVASGGSNSKKDKHYIEIPENAKAQLYYRLDIPFRDWLRTVDPECEDGKHRFEKQREWKAAAKQIAYNYAKELVSETDDAALVGHMTDKKLYSSANAMNKFIGQINKIYPKE